MISTPEDWLFVLPEFPVPNALDALALAVYKRVFRTVFDEPGFALIRFSSPIASSDLRRFMVALKLILSSLHENATGMHLAYQSMLRFDQQVTTKFHLDGAPEESYLMLGYEASPVESLLAFADYTKAAFDLGITPETFLAEYNPMFAAGERQLAFYITKLDAFLPSASQVVLINNSRLPYLPEGTNSLGVMHQATVIAQLGTSRIINSTMLSPVADLSEEVVSLAEQQTYITTTAISSYSG